MLAAPPVVVHCFIPAASDAASAFQKQGAQFVLTASSLVMPYSLAVKCPTSPFYSFWTLVGLQILQPEPSPHRCCSLFLPASGPGLCRDGLSGSRELRSPRAKRDARHLSAFVVFSLSLSHSVPLVFCCFSLPPLSWPAFLRGLRSPLFQAR